MKTVNNENIKNLKEAEKILTEHVNTYSNKDMAAREFENDLNKISVKYEELKNKFENTINATVNSKTRQYEQLIKDLGMQISVLLFENTSLRQFIEKRIGEVVLPMHIDIFKNQDNFTVQEYGLYTTMQELVKQNAELKRSLNHGVSPTPSSRHSSHAQPKLQKSSSQQMSHPEQVHSESESTALLKKLESSEKDAKKFKEQKENIESKANEMLKENSELNRKLRALQNENNLLEQKFKASEAMVVRLKTELGRSGSYGGMNDESQNSSYVEVYSIF